MTSSAATYSSRAAKASIPSRRSGHGSSPDLDPSDLAIQTRLNGELRQKSRTSQLIFNCDYLVSFISQVMTLLPGDVISTGTPAGVGPMKVGDTVEVEIEQIGCLRNTIAAPR